MGWLEGFGAAIVGGIRKLIVAVILLIVLAALIHWGRNNSGQAQATSDKVMGAVASGIGWAADGVTGMTGGQAATTGPEVIYVHNTAPLRWHVGGAIKVWNRGLTNVKLQAVQACPKDGTCFEVSQVPDLPRENGRLVMGRTKTFLTKEIWFNAEAVGQVDPSLFAVAACHELGHALGLDGKELGGTHGHSASVKSCMHATVTTGVSTRPAKADYAAVNAKYGD